MTARLRLSPGARAAVLARSGGACESCGLEWPWALYLFLRDLDGRAAAANLVVLCGPCSIGRPGPFAPLLARPSLRDRLRAANNRRTGAVFMTDARRRRLVAARGGRCQACGVSGDQRQLEVHHKVGVFRGGDDSEPNLAVLCFACHHHLVRCEVCGGWAKKPAVRCRYCETSRLLSEWTEASPPLVTPAE